MILASDKENIYIKPKVKEGNYGYCTETGEAISLKRLDARPIALLSISAQERHEKHERSYREE